jgi:hypothetical protein
LTHHHHHPHLFLPSWCQTWKPVKSASWAGSNLPPPFVFQPSSALMTAVRSCARKSRLYRTVDWCLILRAKVDLPNVRSRFLR